MVKLSQNGLYAITPQWYPDRTRLVAAVTQVLEGGAAVVQFRDKSGDAGWRAETTTVLLELCTRYNAPLIVNDDVGLALNCGADGVHLGRDDVDPRAARDCLGAKALIGVSCYNDLGRASAAAAAGADYLAFGAVFSSATKPAAVRCGLDVITAARKLGRPLVAIGGITHENGAPVIRAGADFLAVINGIFDQADAQGAARRFASLWSGDA